VARFLVIDDEPAVSATFARMLGVEGHGVLLAESAPAALASLDDDAPPPDAIILDIRLPGMGGLEFLRIVRRDPRLARIPVGVVTGDYFLKEEVLAELAELGVTVRYKPLGLAEVTEFAHDLVSAADASPQA
jgi:CheY-like chemotaxis protein